MFLFYQAFAHFSKEMAADIPQLFCVFLDDEISA